MEIFKGKTAELGSTLRELEMNLQRARKGNPPCSSYPEGKSSMRNQSLERLEKKNCRYQVEDCENEGKHENKRRHKSVTWTK